MRRILILLLTLLFAFYGVKAQYDATFEDIIVKGKAYHLGIFGAVNLGISVKWAACNVGAESPSDYDNHNAWGETESKEWYNWLLYFDSVQRNNHYYKKYNVGHKDQHDLEDAVAHVQMVKNWRMPTKDEFDELLSRCTWIWSKYEGHRGDFVVGSTGNAIFLPAGGHYEGYRLYDEWMLWSLLVELVCENSPDSAYYLSISSGIFHRYASSRAQGKSVHAVCL